MALEETKALGREALAVGQAARATEHPMSMAGVLLALYRDASSDVERKALAYAFSLLVQSYKTRPGHK
jgi:hypothetical protein